MQLFIFYLLLFVQLIIFECHSHLSNIWFVWVFPEESSCVFSCQKVFVSILHFSFLFLFFVDERLQPHRVLSMAANHQSFYAERKHQIHTAEFAYLYN